MVLTWGFKPLVIIEGFKNRGYALFFQRLVKNVGNTLATNTILSKSETVGNAFNRGYNRE